MHSRISVNSICFDDQSFNEQTIYWRRLGLKRVSLTGVQLEKEGLNAARRALSNCKLESIVHPFLLGEHLDPDKSTWAHPRGKLFAQIETAQELGARSIYMLTGGRGTLKWETAAQVFAEAIAPCVERAKSVGINLMVENAPALYPDIHLSLNLRDTIALAQLANVGICLDLFNCWTEAGVYDLIQQAMPYCGLVQISDYCYGDRSLPARAVPGDGNIPLVDMLHTIIDGGYRGAFELELLGPRIEAEGYFEAVHRGALWLERQLRARGVEG